MATARLDILNGRLAGQTRRVERLPFVIGRNAEAGLRLEESGVWDRHVELEWRFPEGFVARRRADATATVNGQPFTEQRLRNGDVLELGGAKVQFWLGDVSQKRLALRETLVWAALVALAAAQLWLITRLGG
ncbi:MAG: FHA domain-containing protein [Pedosphaera sp.]|nr:FHA domain-containing protein [Pedosphaera sp.]MSS99844.1 FHA domain-containing protein [Pedosphaera sp.]